MRRTARTVRAPVARMAPTARVWALAQTPWENSGAKAARMATISGGRSTGVVSRIGGPCTTVDHGRCPPDLPANFGMEAGRTTVRPGQSRVRGGARVLPHEAGRRGRDAHAVHREPRAAPAGDAPAGLREEDHALVVSRARRPAHGL